MADIKAELRCPYCDKNLIQTTGETIAGHTFGETGYGFTITLIECPSCVKGVWHIGDGEEFSAEEIGEILEQKFRKYGKSWLVEQEYPVFKIQVPYSSISKVIRIIKKA